MYTLDDLWKEKRAEYEEWRERQYRKGRQEGLLEGHIQGRRDGELLAKREAVLLVLRTRFRDLPSGWNERVIALKTPEELDALLTRAVTVSTLEELGETR